MKKRFFLLTVLLFLCCGMLTACHSKHVLSYKNPDGSVSRITAESAVPFERAPYFEAGSSSLTMTFNGKPWYRASIISREEAEMLKHKQTFLGESSNLSVYTLDDDANFSYLYLLKLDGTNDSLVRFDSTGPDSYGEDFTTRISFSVDKTVTVPDMDIHYLEETSEEE